MQVKIMVKNTLTAISWRGENGRAGKKFQSANQPTECWGIGVVEWWRVGKHSPHHSTTAPLHHSMTPFRSSAPPPPNQSAARRTGAVLGSQ